MKRPVAPVKMWAVVIVNPRSEWIHWETIARLKRQAWEKYLANWIPEYHAKAFAELRAGNLKLRRVIVKLA